MDMTDSIVHNDADMRAIYMLGSTGFKPCGYQKSTQPRNGSETSGPFALIDLDLFNLILEALCSNCFIVCCIVLVFCYSSAINVISYCLHSVFHFLM
ncbi:hypothetical protein M8J76_006821 [Diaphorina citri]|nr:hypothetical protein M8J75_007396 [Diaphorina citri]KAI5733032.1 hypothetical protein M8J76_006821 [Diaphorina citri]KAI5738731.1 hypothetical protein M8J77_010499 [Diaphorina citri]